jgi:hypothetical protein
MTLTRFLDLAVRGARAGGGDCIAFVRRLAGMYSVEYDDE